MKFALGQFDSVAYNHGEGIIASARRTLGVKDDVPADAVTVAVWVNGYLQFAGSDAHLSAHRVDRDMAKSQAFNILGRMNPEGRLDQNCAERRRVWVVVETAHESASEGEDTRLRACASREGAIAVLHEDAKFMQNCAEHTENELRCTGKQGEWWYDYYIMEMEVEP